MNQTRRGFIAGVAAFGAVGGRLSASAADAPVDYDAIQKEIDALPPKAFEEFERFERFEGFEKFERFEGFEGFEKFERFERFERFDGKD